jgi:hypothetical protein
MRDEVESEALVRTFHEAAVVGGTPLQLIPDLPEGEPFAREWNTFKREAARLIAAGERGRFALIKGDSIVSTWDTLRDALQAGRERFGGEPVFVQEIQPYVRQVRWGDPRAADVPPTAPPQAACPQREDRPGNALHYSKLPPAGPESVIARERETYRAEVARLLAEGREGQHVLIKDQEVLGCYATREDALEAGYRRFLLRPFLVHQVQTCDPLHFTRVARF